LADFNCESSIGKSTGSTATSNSTGEEQADKSARQSKSQTACPAGLEIKKNFFIVEPPINVAIKPLTLKISLPFYTKLRGCWFNFCFAADPHLTYF
jgi:hypothetical protein